MQNADKTQGRRVELILRQVDSLPTLPAVATRLLSLTANDETHARQVVELVNSDPALTAKVLAMCRRADMGIRGEIITVEKAVVLLGFNAIRNAALSVKVIEVFGAGGNGKEQDQDLLRFDRVGFWRHSLAVGIAAELIAAAHRGECGVAPDEAFVCGLLHDIGKLALDHVLPKSFARIIELTDLNHGNIAEFERRIVGIDHHTVGKRLAEQWRLPHRLQDCIWLHGSSYETLPRLEHRNLIGLIALADLLVRQHHIGYSGNYVLKHAAEDLARTVGLDPAKVTAVVPKVFEQMERRSEMMGLGDTPSRELFLSSIQQANQVLGAMNSTLERKQLKSSRMAQMLDAVSAFHATATPGRSVQDVINEVAASAWATLGPGFYAILFQQESGNGEERGWLVCQYGDQAKPARSELLEPPPHSPDLSAMDPREPVALNLMSILPWITDYLVEAPDLREVRLLPLSCGWGTAAVLVHDRQTVPPWQQLAALTSTWGAAIAGASAHDGARRLGEDLAEANLALAEAQDRLLHTESMARVGEMAAGAAHEMNNPLAVISGRSQLLAMNLPKDTREHKAAQTIVEQAHRLSNLISSLKLFADPPQAQRVPTEVSSVLQQSLDFAREQMPEVAEKIEMSMAVPTEMPPAMIDPELIGRAVNELLLNALAAEPKHTVAASARIDEEGRILTIQVVDDGEGMDAHTLAHAMDPFFSAKHAGRRVGMGLPRAQQFAAAHGGGIELRSVLGEGTRATLTVRLDLSSGPADTGSWNAWRGLTETRRDEKATRGAGESIAASNSR